MHEIGIATETYRLCREGLSGGNAMRLVRVRVAVGELSAVEPDLLRFAWTAVTAGGADEGCELDIEWCPARQFCAACGEIRERGAGSWLRLCPECGDPLRVEGGDELDLLRVEAEPLGAAAGERP